MFPQLDTEDNPTTEPVLEQPEPATKDNITTEPATKDNLSSEPASDYVTSEPEDMSMAAPLAISAPIKEWMATRRENIRSMGTFFNTSNFQVSLSVMFFPCQLSTIGSILFRTLY